MCLLTHVGHACRNLEASIQGGRRVQLTFKLSIRPPCMHPTPAIEDQGGLCVEYMDSWVGARSHTITITALL